MNNEFTPEGTPKRGPGRPPKQARQDVAQQVSAKPEAGEKRAEQTKRERRRRRSDDPVQNTKLFIPEHVKRSDMEYRWVNDTAGGRVHDKTVLDDWNVVTEQGLKGPGDPDKDANEGTPIRRIVGKNDDGSPLYAVLCAKPKEFYEEDKKTEQARLDVRDQELRRKVPSSGEGLDQAHSYIPGGSNQITHTR